MAKALWEVLPAEKKARIKTNTEALETVQPKDLAAGDISVRISVNWIPLEIYQQFMYELLDTSIQSKDISKSCVLSIAANGILQGKAQTGVTSRLTKPMEQTGLMPIRFWSRP